MVQPSGVCLLLRDCRGAYRGRTYDADMLLVLAMFIISKYELTDEKVDAINEEIERRHLEEE